MVNGYDLSTVGETYDHPEPLPTREECDAAAAELQRLDDMEIIRRRQAELLAPPELTAWRAAVRQVNDEYESGGLADLAAAMAALDALAATMPEG
ncbi:MAG: hypothetical protein OEV91_03765 [Desulfobulbaceae bacterium]|nr:hypothetical protein [Desulfobulbaceae bacterium]